MDTKIQPIRNLPAKAHRYLRWGEYGFLIIGFLALSWCVIVLTEARVFQFYENWRLEQSLKRKPSTITSLLAHWFPSLSSNAISARAGSPSIVERKTGVESPVHSQSANIPAGDSFLVGRIEIPRIGLSAIISEGIDSRTLRRAVGHIPGTALPGDPGNIGIAGHRDTFFRKLQDIRQNDIITLTTVHGSYRYRVQETRVLGPNDTEVLEDSIRPTLTLVTCYPFHYVGPAPKRFVVRALETDGSKSRESRQFYR